MNLLMQRMALAGVLMTARAATAVAGAPSDLAQLEFFEKKIRPVLAESCYECHSASSKKVKGGLLLDTREGLLKGGDSGPAVVPGEVRKSLLLVSMRHDDPDPDLAMPPKKDKLADEVIADFEAWVRMGAPDPRSGAAAAKTAAWDAAKAAGHWAFKPLSHSPPPKPADPRGFVQNPLDAFILANLQEKKLAPAAQADRQTLLRRATYDLTGLPPSPQEVQAFLADRSPDAWEKVIDRLLASPHYGERWGRHWLDVARYADTTGDRVGGAKRPPVYPYAWTYRDYVIDSFNQDVPYDRFILEQIAADRLPASEDHSKLAALGFLTVGKRFLNNDNDVLDDRIDVVAKGLMGLTAACARCHDHKFDPIPTKDYYALHGIFNSSEEPGEGPLLADPERNPKYPEFKAEVVKVEAEAAEYRREMAGRLVAGMMERAGDYLLFAQETKTSSDTRKKGDNLRLAARERKLEPELAVVWIDRLKDLAGKKDDPVFGPWFQFAALPAESFADKAAALAADLARSSEVNPALAQVLGSHHPADLKELAGIYTELLGGLHQQLKLEPYVSVRNGGKKAAFNLAPTQSPMAEPSLETLRKYFFSADSPVAPDEKLMARTLGNQFSNNENLIRSKIVNLELTHPGAPIRAMTLVDRAQPKDSAILIRGEPGNKGALAPRQFLSLLGGERHPVTNGSGRLELAEAITRPDNPLTARVFVNRVWQWHFGQGMVRTVSDFGTRSEPPTHPELLDWLAAHFMEEGWSVKKLHRLMMLSSTYQLDSRPSAAATASDPSNQWLSHFNLRRLDLEEIRDTLLDLGGNLDRAMGGPPFNLAGANAGNKGGYGVPNLSASKTGTNRRTVYGFVDRAGLQEMFTTFDFANPDLSTGERVLTTVPQQALFMMNSPFVIEQLKRLLTRPDFPVTGSDKDKIQFLFQTAFQRTPSPEELALGLEFLTAQAPPEQSANSAPEASSAAKPGDEDPKAATRKLSGKNAQPVSPLSPLEQYAQIVLLTNELVFLN